jgi:D-psicose/D-tagatose/L-ribulose 3-epimerase
VTFGIHPFLWTDVWSYESVHFIERARELGFDVLDIPVRTLDERDVRATRAQLEALGMRAVAVAGIAEPYNLASNDELVWQTTLEYLKKLVRNTHGIGATILAGVYFGPINKLVGRGPTKNELARSAAGLKELARYAQDYGVQLALEPVSRYETYLLNTTQQGLDMLARVDEWNVGLLLDTYQMNIEEKDFYAPLVSAGSRLFHMHVCENDRGILGSGLVHWEKVFQGLAEINYKGTLTIESFVTDVPAVAASTCVWRKLAPDGDTLAREGLAYLKSMARKYHLVQ